MRGDVRFSELSDATRLQRLRPPAGRVRMVLDTDTYNETDDQFALVHALLSPERLAVEAIYAAPFHNARSDGPGHGMELSYQEILRLLGRLGRSPDAFAFRGSTGYLGPEGQPRESDAVRDLVARGLASPNEDPLHVVAIGAITNVASALLIEPALADKIVVVWLGGHALSWPDTKEFNLRQDVSAARTLLDCGVPLVLVPCMGVTSHLHTSVPEIDRHVAPHGELGGLPGIPVQGDARRSLRLVTRVVGRGHHRLPARPPLGADRAGTQPGADRSDHLEHRSAPPPGALCQLRAPRPDLPRPVRQARCPPTDLGVQRHCCARWHQAYWSRAAAAAGVSMSASPSGKLTVTRVAA